MERIRRESKCFREQADEAITELPHVREIGFRGISESWYELFVRPLETGPIVNVSRCRPEEVITYLGRSPQPQVFGSTGSPLSLVWGCDIKLFPEICLSFGELCAKL